MNLPSSWPVTTGASLPLSVTVFSLLSTAAPETFYKIYILSDGIDGENRNSVERLGGPV